jgi:methylated-DNA-[protein]-cysteine S-methyltransferase
MDIPYGETRSYGAVAEALGMPGAARAVGMANNRNPVPVIVPCHRVVGHDGSLVGYGGGLPIKTALLNLECRHLTSRRGE